MKDETEYYRPLTVDERKAIQARKHEQQRRDLYVDVFKSCIKNDMVAIVADKQARESLGNFDLLFKDPVK